jgi:hypothetical protein
MSSFKGVNELSLSEFSLFGSACLNFIRARARAELKGRAKNPRAQAHNKSSRAEPIRELALIFNLI